MNVETLREYCLSKKGATESFPFDDTTLVFKVGDKIFALISLEGDNCISLKFDPELAIELRESFPFVTPGYHLNKTHWNTVIFDGSASDRQLKEWIDHSYELVRNQLPARIKKTLP